MLLLLFSSALAFSLGEDLEKKYAPIIGTYEFYVEAQVMNIKFWVEEEKLWAAPEGETPGELKPMEDGEFKFEVTTDDGMYFVIDFVKDESGKFNKCIIQATEMELEGTRIEK
jgi:hypothetical protein